MADKKIKVLVVPSDEYGVGLYRSKRPHEQLQKMFGDEFEVQIMMNPNWADFKWFEQFDIIHFHKGLFSDEGQVIFHNALRYFKEHNITTVMDIDDNWDVGQYHPLYLSNKAIKAPEKITTNFRLVDYVTTTTEIYANKIRKWNKNVVIFPNGIDPDEEQYQPIKYPSDRIRFGFVMGSSHERDMEQMKGLAGKLCSAGLRDKIQIVLCGYDLRGTITMVDKDGKTTGQRPIEPKESVWYRYLLLSGMIIVPYLILEYVFVRGILNPPAFKRGGIVTVLFLAAFVGYTVSPERREETQKECSCYASYNILNVSAFYLADVLPQKIKEKWPDVSFAGLSAQAAEE